MAEKPYSFARSQNLQALHKEEISESVSRRQLCYHRTTEKVFRYRVYSDPGGWYKYPSDGCDRVGERSAS